jgi:hypothetical protein
MKNTFYTSKTVPFTRSVTKHTAELEMPYMFEHNMATGTNDTRAG